ncbi:MAG: MBL fold metallo-hydrolase [Thermoplasmata archaeon]|nr:MAG: MBL fold metallo-hydrolase [Thermoplasmata archaeon]
MLIHVIKPGILVRNNLGMILQASSTVTLVRAGEHNIMVDTGLPREGKQILQGLSVLGLSESDIDIVINTHLHGDHMGNNGLFKRAYFIAHEKEFPPRIAKVKVIRGEYEVCENVKIIETPGHSLGSISVVVWAPEQSRTFVMAGDALPIRDNYIKWVPPGINFDPQIALQSMRRIVDIADVVVPGHDDMFEVEKK